VRIEAFRIREGSGGRGHFPGGHGVVRSMRFLEAMTATVLSSRRQVPPYGLAGGENGACGHNYVVRQDGQVVELKGNDEIATEAGDLCVIETPGGGGYGSP